MGGGAKYHAKHQSAVLALLEEPTIELAAKKIKVGHATLTRWLADPHFREKYHKARSEAFESGLTRLQHLCSAAVSTLEKNLTCGHPATETRSAIAVLERATDTADLFNITERLESVERSLHENEHE